MRTAGSKTLLSLGLVLGCSPMFAQAQTSTAELEQLKTLVTTQQKSLEQQQAQIQALQSALAEQKQLLIKVIDRSSGGTTLVPASGHMVVDLSAGPHGQSQPDNTQEPVPAPSGQEAASEPPPVPNQGPLTEAQEKTQDELQRGPEIADITPETPALKLGPAKVRILGYPAMTMFYRSDNAGGNTGTSFASLPFDNTVKGNLSEFRISPQSTRLALRVDADLNTSYAAGYFEMDFGGSPIADNIAVTSSSYTFRIRQAWFDWGKGKWEMTGGQLFSLMTPNKLDILPWPGDVATTQVIDTNYVAGLVWGRYPQFRVVYHASKKLAWGFSIENPEQQVGKDVVFPTQLASNLNQEYNLGSSGVGGSNQGLAIPNTTPDFVLKGSYTTKVAGDRTLHLDVGTVMRTFRSWSGGGNNSHDYAFGWGVGANFNVQLVKTVRYVLDGFATDGAGRYIGGLVPDVIVKNTGQISPIHAYSWVSGFEIASNKNTGWYAYYSGVYAQKNATLNSDGTCCVGWGYNGVNTGNSFIFPTTVASNGADRIVSEATAGYSRVFWKVENVGSMQWGLQYAYVWNQPWSPGKGPGQASTNMVFTQVRYNLP